MLKNIDDLKNSINSIIPVKFRLSSLFTKGYLDYVLELINLKPK